MADKTTAIHDLELGYQEFRGPLARLEDDDYAEVWLGDWNLSQLLAHMAGWYREMTGAVERVRRGERPIPEGVDYGDSDAWNAKFAVLAKPGKAALADFDAAYAAYLGAAKALDEDAFGTEPGKDRPKIGNRLLQGAGIGHFEEHQQQLDEWLKSKDD